MLLAGLSVLIGLLMQALTPTGTLRAVYLANNPAQALKDIDAYRARVLTNFDHLSLADHDYGNDSIRMDWRATTS